VSFWARARVLDVASACTHFLRILFSGAFDAFPRLKIILGHNGEGLPLAMDRLIDHTG
jgi:predicted TIM-barrel fold metal-dependent hydrolase